MGTTVDANRDDSKGDGNIISRSSDAGNNGSARELAPLVNTPVVFENGEKKNQQQQKQAEQTIR